MGGGVRLVGLIWPVAMYAGEYNLNVTRPVGECFQRLVSNPEVL